MSQWLIKELNTLTGVSVFLLKNTVRSFFESIMREIVCPLFPHVLPIAEKFFSSLDKINKLVYCIDDLFIRSPLGF